MKQQRNNRLAMFRQSVATLEPKQVQQSNSPKHQLARANRFSSIPMLPRDQSQHQLQQFIDSSAWPSREHSPKQNDHCQQSSISYRKFVQRDCVALMTSNHRKALGNISQRRKEKDTMDDSRNQISIAIKSTRNSQRLKSNFFQSKSGQHEKREYQQNHHYLPSKEVGTRERVLNHRNSEPSQFISETTQSRFASLNRSNPLSSSPNRYIQDQQPRLPQILNSLGPSHRAAEVFRKPKINKKSLKLKADRYNQNQRRDDDDTYQHQTERQPLSVATPPQFTKQVDLVIKDDSIINGYHQLKRGGNPLQRDRLQVYQQDFVTKLNKMDEHLNQEVQLISRSMDQEELQSQKSQRIQRKGTGIKKLGNNESFARNRQAYHSVNEGSPMIKVNFNAQLKSLETHRRVGNMKLNEIKEDDSQGELKEVSFQSRIPLNKKKLFSQFQGQLQLERETSQDTDERTNLFSAQDDRRVIGEQKSQESWEFTHKVEQLFRDFDTNSMRPSQTSTHPLKQVQQSPRSVSPTLQHMMSYQYNIGKAIEMLSTNIKDKKAFYDLCKNYSLPLAEELNEDPKLNFFQTCNQELVLALPMLAKIQEKCLVLSGYRLNKGNCKALKRGLGLVKGALTRITLINNGLDDSMLRDILKGIQAQDTIESIIIKKNNIGLKSQALLTNILQRSWPHNLDELRLVNCKISQSLLQGILSRIREKPLISKLGLVKVQLTEQCLSVLVEILNTSKSLRDLDLSWNKMKPQNFKALLEALSNNRTLSYLNLSWNNLLNTIISEEETWSDFVVSHLSKFVKYNKNLLHLDLSSTRLTDKEIKGLGTSLRRAKSLVSIHFSGNPGVSMEVREFLFQKLRCRPFKEDLDPEISLLIRKAMIDSPQREGNIVQKIQLHNNFAKKRAQGVLSQVKDFREDDKLIMQRHLGHKSDIPGSAQWQLLTKPDDHCWVCDKWIYSLIFWNKSIGFRCQTELSTSVVDALNQQIASKNTCDVGGQNNTPLISGTFSNWKQRRMVPIGQYCQMIDPFSLTPLEHLKKQGKIRESIESKSQLSKRETQLVAQTKYALDKSYNSNWKDYLVKNIAYKKAYYANIEWVKELDPDEQLFVLPCFLKPGKHLYTVSMEEPNRHSLETELFTHQCLTPVREEELVPFQIKSKKKTTLREFKKENSVFREWKEDTQVMLSQMLDDDFRFWKLHRFIKDEQDRDGCKQIIRDNIVLLKKIFISEICKSGYPTITWIDYSNFCEQCNIQDKNVGLATIDRVFIASNVELEKMEDNPDKALCRYEFYEILIRLAQAKYKDTGASSSFAEALQKLLDDNVFPNAIAEPWQEFRDTELWTMEVNDLLQANLEGLRRVYQWYFDPMKKYMTMQEALSLMMKDTALNLNEKDATYCYGMSKMTVVYESDHNYLYRQLKFVELLEMVGRVAQFKFRGTQVDNKPLTSKIEYVLEIILKLVNMERREVNVQLEEWSESDDEY